MQFEILSEISGIETFATGSAIREIGRLRRIYGRGRWRKRKASPAFVYPMARSAMLRYIGMKPAALAARNSKLSVSSEKLAAMTKPLEEKLVVCVDNAGYPASLERRKIYVALPDPDAEKDGLMRIVDESGDDYLYPTALFRSIELPKAVKRAILAAA